MFLIESTLENMKMTQKRSNQNNWTLRHGFMHPKLHSKPYKILKLSLSKQATFKKRIIFIQFEEKDKGAVYRRKDQGLYRCYISCPHLEWWFLSQETILSKIKLLLAFKVYWGFEWRFNSFIWWVDVGKVWGGKLSFSLWIKQNSC